MVNSGGAGIDGGAGNRLPTSYVCTERKMVGNITRFGVFFRYLKGDVKKIENVHIKTFRRSFIPSKLQIGV